MPDVIIILNQDQTASTNLPRVQVSKGRHEEVCWICPQGAATAQFKGANGTPFDSDHFLIPFGGKVCTGPVTVGKPGQIYTYSIVGRIRNDARNYVADPEVQVDP